MMMAAAMNIIINMGRNAAAAMSTTMILARNVHAAMSTITGMCITSIHMRVMNLSSMFLF